jgi:hypothetical protein
MQVFNLFKAFAKNSLSSCYWGLYIIKSWAYIRVLGQRKFVLENMQPDSYARHLLWLIPWHKLENIKIKNVWLTPAVLASINRSLTTKYSKIKNLSLPWCCLTNKSLGILLFEIKSNQSLTFLDLSHNEICGEVNKPFSFLLQMDGSVIETLILDSNELLQKKFLHILALILTYPGNTLKHISLRETIVKNPPQITRYNASLTQGFELFADILKFSSVNIENLYLDSNKLEQYNCGYWLANLICETTPGRIGAISLQNNALSKTTISKLLTATTNPNSAIAALDLSYNKINTIESFKIDAPQMSSLRSLSIIGCFPRAILEQVIIWITNKFRALEQLEVDAAYCKDLAWSMTQSTKQQKPLIFLKSINQKAPSTNHLAHPNPTIQLKAGNKRSCFI